jgi:hypothetical protein
MSVKKIFITVRWWLSIVLRSFFPKRLPQFPANLVEIKLGELGVNTYGEGAYEILTVWHEGHLVYRQVQVGGRQSCDGDARWLAVACAMRDAFNGITNAVAQLTSTDGLTAASVPMKVVHWNNLREHPDFLALHTEVKRCAVPINFEYRHSDGALHLRQQLAIETTLVTNA